MQPQEVKILNHPKCEVLPYQPKLKWAEKYAGRIYEKLQSNEPGQVLQAKIWSVVLPILLSLSIVGISCARKFCASLENRRLSDEFHQSISEKQPPVIPKPIACKTDSATFNHLTDFVIHDGVIWTRSRLDSSKPWEAIYFEKGLVPISIRADGANLIVVDQNKTVHYKKVIHDKYHSEDQVYRCSDKATKNNWKEEWFNFPYIYPLVNLFIGKKLTLPEFTKDWAISQRGQFNGYIEDKGGNPHRVRQGVTTLYILDQSGQYIYLFDPWKPKNVLMKILIPGTANSAFVAEKIAASASQIFVIGYEYKIGENGKQEKIPAIRTLIADIDSLGSNPGLSYSYLPEERKGNSSVRLLPTAPDGWRTHSLPDGEITDCITLFQTGEGNEEREMRIVGKQNGVDGYWHKTLSAQDWSFTSDALWGLPENRTSLVRSEIDETEFRKPVVFNWKAEVKDTCFNLENFNQDAAQGKLVVNNQAELLLHRRENLIKKILTGGKDWHDYDLVLEDPAVRHHLPKELHAHFSSRSVIPVKVYEKRDELIIRDPTSPLFGLKITLNKN